MENGFVEIYVNAQIDDGSEIAGLMKVMAEEAAYDDERFPKTSARKRIFKTNEKGVSEMCEIYA